jgi:hypothetical protein
MKTGQRVVCIKTGKWQPVVKGVCYTVKDILDCHCGVLAINVGFKEIQPTGIVQCHKCKRIMDNRGKAFTEANKFIPLDESWTEEVIAEALTAQLTKPLQTV